MSSPETPAPPADSIPARHDPEPGLRWIVIASCTAALAAGWIAAGSTGLLAYPLQRSLVWLCLAIAFVVDLPRLTTSSGSPGARAFSGMMRGGLLAVTGLLTLWMVASTSAPTRIAAIAVFFGVLQLVHGLDDREEKQGKASAARMATALGLAVFAIYQLLLYSVPVAWHASNAAGALLGRVAATLTGEDLAVGATYGGLDFLVLSVATVLLWLRGRGQLTIRNVAWCAGGILAMHFAYFGVLVSHADIHEGLLDLSKDLGKGVAPILEKNTAAPNTLRLEQLSPWNLPVVALVGHLLVFVLLMRAHLPKVQTVDVATSEASADDGGGPWLAIGAAAVLALLLPASATLQTGELTLQGKKVVAFEKFFGNWEKPKHGDYGRLSIGMYGMLGPFIESLGGTFVRSKELSEKDLADADVLLLIFPHDSWEEGQIQRVQRYVENGGSLLILGEHTTKDEQKKLFLQGATLAKDANGDMSWNFDRSNDKVAQAFAAAYARFPQYLKRLPPPDRDRAIQAGPKQRSSH